MIEDPRKRTPFVDDAGVAFFANILRSNTFLVLTLLVLLLFLLFLLVCALPVAFFDVVPPKTDAREAILETDFFKPRVVLVGIPVKPPYAEVDDFNLMCLLLPCFFSLPTVGHFLDGFDEAVVVVLFAAARLNKFFFRSATLGPEDNVFDNATCDGRGFLGGGCFFVSEDNVFDNATCDGRGFLGGGCFFVSCNATCDGRGFLGGGCFFFSCNATCDGRGFLGGGDDLLL